jgi:hypothetical protein
MFTLIQDSDMWVTARTGSWVNYVWVEGTPVVTKKSGLIEPFSSEETSLILPQGVSSSEAIIIHTEHDLKVYNNITGNESIADLITLKDPVTNPTTFKYMVLGKEDWDANSSFTLVPSYHVYMAVRLEQQ